MFELPTMMSTQKPPASLYEQEKAARQVSAQFLEMVLKPMFKEGSFGGDGWMGDSTTSETLIKPMMIQNMASALANKGDALGLYPIFLKAIQRIQKQNSEAQQ